MKRTILCLLMMFGCYTGFGQSNDYQSKQNSHYWKNRSPFAGYWQQDVHYTIDAHINEKSNIVSASEELVYTNNSPDTLRYVYFHLYQNAFTKGSYLEDLHNANHAPIHRMGEYQKQGLGTTVDQVTVDGQSVQVIMDNTVMKIELPAALYPNYSCTFKMNFKTYFDRGDFRRRMALGYYYGFPTYNGVHWYPRICVYDMKKGWDVDQHLNKELYGDYGQFDVSLTFADNYVVEATGQLKNENEVLPKALREKLDIRNFANKPWNEKPSVVTPYDSTKRKTWRYRAINVHDFAFTANPFYRLGETSWNGIRCVAIVKEPHCGKWQTAPEYVAKIIKTFSEDFGMYEYPKMVAADADDGMEYPMLTLDGGAEPDFHGLFVHEIGHNWFYGMIGNNETYRAALDEGFTQFLTAWGLRHIDGDTMIESQPKNKWVAKQHQAPLAMDRNIYNRYMYDAIRNEDKPLNTHSNDFHSALGHENGYSNVYHKTATMLYNLQYVLGDELFQKAMQHYVAQWKFCHPYFEDFRASIIQYTHQDLNWFFDEWLETTKHIDYGIVSYKKGKTKNEYTIKLKRYGEMQMPVDLAVTSKSGQVYHFHIPNTYFRKKTNATVLPQWYGWDLLHPTYQAQVMIPDGIRKVEIDPTHRLADNYMLNNYKKHGACFHKPSVKWHLDRFMATNTNWKQYSAFIRPDVWWNPIDGLKAGIHVDGHYMNFMKKLYATVWYNSRVLTYMQYRPYDDQGWYDNVSPVDYTLRYETPFRRKNNKMSWGVDSRWMDGYSRQNIYTYLNITSRQQFRIDGISLWRGSQITNAYLFAPKEWSSYSGRNSKNNTMKNSYVQLKYTTSYNGERCVGNIALTAHLPVTYDYSYIQSEWKHSTSWKKFEWNSRVFARYGRGKSIPTESALYLSGGNPEEWMENKFTRSQGIIPLDYGGYSTTGFSNIQSGGGLNLRGYSGYYAVDEDDKGVVYLNYKSRSGAAINMELDFDRYFSKIRPKLLRDLFHLDTYLFADAGLVERGLLNTSNLSLLQPTNSWSKVRMDAGVGAALTLKRFPLLETVKPITIRFDMPLFLSSPPYANDAYFAWRWVIGVGRAF